MESVLNTTLGTRLSAYLVTADDFKRQRTRVNKRILKLRRDLNLVTKDTKNYSAKEQTSKITPQQYNENKDYGLLELLLAERDMLYAHEIKAKLDINSEKSSSFTTLLKTKMKRALFHVDNLIKLTADETDKKLRIEVYIYAALVAGQLSITRKQWAKALNAFSIAKCSLDYLNAQDSDKESFNKTLCSELLENTVDPSLNLAASQLHDVPATDLKTLSRKYCHERYFPRISVALDLIDPSFTKDISSSVQLQKEVDWRGHVATIYNDELAYKIQELTSNKEWSEYNDVNQFDHVIASWISILELHKEDSQKNKDDDDMEKVQDRAILSTYINYNLLFTKLKRDLLLVGQLAAHNNVEENKDIIRIYSGITQLVDELKELPGVYNDEDLHESLENLEKFYNSQKNVIIAESYQFNSRFSESLKIYNYVNQELKISHDYYKVEFPFEVSTNTEVALFKVHLEKKVLQAQVSAQFEQSKKAACSKYTIEDTKKFPLGLEVINLDKIEPVMCKPVLFDIAFNYISPAPEAAQPVQKPTPASEFNSEQTKKRGFFGIFGGSNSAQAFLASIVGLLYTIVTSTSSPFDVFTQNGKQGWQVFKSLVLISVCSSVASPIGYKSLAHLDYLAYLLAKSCKLIPVMFVHFTLYKTRFPLFKYVVASLVTLGVTIFTLAHSKESKKVNDGNTPLGLAYLIGSMLLDGFTNSTQDQLFKIPLQRKFTGAKLMCVLNLFIFVLTAGYIILFQTEQITSTFNFIQKYPQLLYDIVIFAGCGAVGQVFIFIILEHFDSIVLITATVTRKMLSMILSVVLFGHYLNFKQWIGVVMVFGGIGFEAFAKSQQKRKRKSN
ncbi:SRP68 [Candida theae]|uniref:Signal recognition particle subunit SRP68 n=1 Tax=Candida theae TaxID=1198502 RepID=A0AAD5FZI9_9ASCO|nr:SRP68 [Candida theae]KAI5961489.1 SRP68 [Candida theae]